MHFIGTTVTERVEWERFQFVNDRPAAWTLSVRASGMFVIPKTAAGSEQIEAFTKQLMDWSGKKYKFRKR